MKKNNGFTAVAVIFTVIAVAELIAAFIAVRKLPETIPLHFNMQWICDGMGSRWNLLLPAVLPVIAAAVGLILLLTGTLKEPKVTAIAILLTELYMIGSFWLIYPTMNSGVKIGEQVDPQAFSALMPLLLSAWFVIIGNYLPIIQPNNTIGLRVPWTINNPQCWRRTHRFAGRVWVAAGLLLGVIELAALALHHAGERWTFFIVIVIFTINVLVPCVYAYQHRDDKATD